MLLIPSDLLAIKSRPFINKFGFILRYNTIFPLIIFEDVKLQSIPVLQTIYERYNIKFPFYFLFSFIINSFNPDYIAPENNVLFKIFDELKDHVYNEVIWFMTPFTWYSITQSLFINETPATTSL